MTYATLSTLTLQFGERELIALNAEMVQETAMTDADIGLSFYRI